MTPTEWLAKAQDCEEMARVCSLTSDRDRFLKQAADWRECARRAAEPAEISKAQTRRGFFGRWTKS